MFFHWLCHKFQSGFTSDLPNRFVLGDAVDYIYDLDQNGEVVTGELLLFLFTVLVDSTSNSRLVF